MKLTWLGHSCYLLDDGASRCVIDPYAPGSVDGLGDISCEAEAVFCTHGHGDHGYKEAVSVTGAPFTMKVEALPEFHDEVRGAKRGPNDVFIITGQDGIKVAHMGDIGAMPSDDHIKAISEADVLLIPVGGFYTVDAKEAKAIADAAGSKIIVPMHYRSAKFGFGVLAELSSFTDLYDDVIYLDTCTFEITKDTAPAVLIPVPALVK